MSIVLDGTTGITTPGLTNTGTETVVNLTTTGNTILGDASTDTLNVGNGGLIKDASGNLGLGVTPSAWYSGAGTLQMKNGAVVAFSGIDGNLVTNAYYDTAWKYYGTGAVAQYNQNGGAHKFFTAPSGTAGNAITFTQAMTLDASGRLIVGSSTAPNNASGMLSVTLTNTPPAIALYQTGGASVGGAAITGSNSGLLMYTASGSWGSETYTERARIDSSGNLLVGTTSTPSASVYGSAFIAATESRRVLLMSGSATTTSNRIEFFNPNGSVGKIDVSGSSTTYGTSSDYRLKHDIAPMTNALEKVSTLKPVIYKWNADNSDGEGFIAHELAEVVPQCVSGEKDAVNEDGSVKPQSIDTSFLVATLTAAIQEQQALIQTLTDRITALENK